jgi:hypothetical protein
MEHQMASVGRPEFGMMLPISIKMGARTAVGAPVAGG